MSPFFDSIVLGLGAMGSAAAFHLARRGASVLGIDQLAPPHSIGSSHGETRVIREAYFEHPVYVPLVQRAYELWNQLQEQSAKPLYLKTGGIMIGASDSTVVTGAIRSAREHRLPHEILTQAQIRERFPALHPAPAMTGVLEPRAGILFPERCIAAHLQAARHAGATLHLNETVLGWEAGASQVTIRTNLSSYSARSLVIAAGPWLPKLSPTLTPHLQIERQVLLWFQPPPLRVFDSTRLPIHLWEYEPDKMFYGFPDLGDGLKIAFHHQGEITDPDRVERNLRPPDLHRMRELMARFLPEVAQAPLLRASVCLYTNTPDGHFILDRHPNHENVILASPCSGHGFKFASAIGEVLADLAQARPPRVDLSLFSATRFASTS